MLHMTSIRTRLDKLEAQLKPDPEPSVWEGIANYLTSGELHYILDTYEAGGSLPAEELQRLWLLGYERRNSGIRAQDVENMFGETPRLVKAYFHRFLNELGEKIACGNVPDVERFDTCRLHNVNIDSFFRLMKSGSRKTIEAYGYVIERLLLDDKPMTVAEFEKLIRPYDVAGATVA